MIDKKWVPNLNIATNLCVRIVYELLKGDESHIHDAIMVIVRNEYLKATDERSRSHGIKLWNVIIQLTQTDSEKLRLSQVRGLFDEMLEKKWVSNLNIATNLCIRIVYELLKGDKSHIRDAILVIVRNEYVKVTGESPIKKPPEPSASGLEMRRQFPGESPIKKPPEPFVSGSEMRRQFPGESPIKRPLEPFVSGSEMRRLYIIRTAFTSANKRRSTNVIDDRTTEITFEWTPEIRKKLTEVKNHYRYKLQKDALNFFGLFIIREADKEEWYKLMSDADSKMKEIEPTAHANIRLISLYVEGDVNGEVYQQMLVAIQGRIYMELLNRLNELMRLPEIPGRSRTALLRLCDRMHLWNVIDDPNVHETIEEYRLQFRNNAFTPVLEDVKKNMADLQSRGAFLEFDEG